MSIQFDAQGKTYAQYLLAATVEVDRAPRRDRVVLEVQSGDGKKSLKSSVPRAPACGREPPGRPAGSSLPESSDPRVREAADILRREGLAEPILSTRPSSPATRRLRARAISNGRQHRGLTADQARAAVEDPLCSRP